MKTNLLKYYIVALYLCSTFIAFAQPGSGSSDGTLDGDGDTTPLAPIDDYVWVLVAVGILLVFLKCRAMYKQKAISKV